MDPRYIRGSHIGLRSGRHAGFIGRNLRGKEVEELKGTKAGLQRTKIFGQTHKDSEPFDDSSIFKDFLVKDLWNIRIRRIIVWSGEYVNGLQIAYENKNSGCVSDEKTWLWSEKHLGTHGTFSEKSVDMHPNEFVTGVEGTVAIWMNHLIIHTNRREIPFGESTAGNHFNIQLPFNYVMTGFCGAKGGHVHNLGVEFFTITSWTTETHYFFPKQFQQFVKTLLTLALVYPSNGQPLFPQSLLWKLPKEILLYIIYLTSFDLFNVKTLHVEYSSASKKAFEVIRNVKTN